MNLFGIPLDADILLIVLAASASLLTLLWAIVLMRGRPRFDRTAVQLETVLNEAQRQVRALQQAHKTTGHETVRLVLRELQHRLSEMSPETMERYEKKAMKVLQEAARLGITLSPEENLQHR